MASPEYDERQAAPVRDTYLRSYITAAQAGAGGVLTFTLGGTADLVWVRVVGGIGMAAIGTNPTQGMGIYCADDEPTPITCRTDEVRVWAPAATTVYVWAYG